MELEQRIELELKDLFVKKEVDMNDDNVKAAIITAASKMAIVSDIVSGQEVIDKLSNNLSENAKSLIDMGPQYVESIIGYAVDFNDYGSATGAYNSQKQEYDYLYNNIKSLSLNNERQL